MPSPCTRGALVRLSAGVPSWASRLLTIGPVPILWPPVPDLPGKSAVAIFAIGLARIGVRLAQAR